MQLDPLCSLDVSAVLQLSQVYSRALWGMLKVSVVLHTPRCLWSTLDVSGLLQMSRVYSRCLCCTPDVSAVL